ncbi:MAG: hypothetical protein ABR544_07265, partial [Gammaproteobacteria bacterium]
MKSALYTRPATPGGRLLLPLLLAVLMTACALPRGPEPAQSSPTPPTEPVAAQPAPSSAPGAYAELSELLLYDILLGEIAGQRGALDEAVRYL